MDAYGKGRRKVRKRDNVERQKKDTSENKRGKIDSRTEEGQRRLEREVPKSQLETRSLVPARNA